MDPRPDEFGGCFNLQFDKNGAILSTKEKKSLAKKRGICYRCGEQTHKIGLVKKLPLTNEKVYNGVCLICFPEKRPAKGTDQELNNDSSHSIRSSKTLFRLKALRSSSKRNSSSSCKQSDYEIDLIDTGDDEHKSSSSLQSEQAPNQEEDFEPRRKRQDEKSMFKFPEALNTDDASIVVKAMHDNNGNPEILQVKCNQLRNIGDNQAGALNEIIPMMDKYGKDSQLQAAACGAIWGMAAEIDGKKSEAAAAGCVHNIVSAMKNAPNDPILLKWACGALSSLSHGLGVREHISNEGAVRMVVLSLKHHWQLQEMLEWCCRALFNFIYVYPVEHHDENSDVIKKEMEWANSNIIEAEKVNAVSIVLYAMQQHRIFYTSHEWAFKFLCHVCDNDFVRDSQNPSILRIYEEEGIEICTTIVKSSNVSSITTVELAIGLLSSLLQFAEEDKYALAKIGDHVDSIIASLQEFSSNAFILERSLFLLRNLSHHSDANRAVINLNGGIEFVFDAMRRYADNSLIQEYGCWTVWICSGSPRTFLSSNERAQETKLVIKAMRAHSSNENLQVAGFGIINNFVALADTAMIFDSVLDDILEIISSQKNQSSVQERACQLIYNICTKDNTKAKCIVECGGAHLITDAMKMFPEQFRVQQAACRALAATSNVDEVSKQAVIDAGGISVTLEAMHKYPELRRRALQILSLLFLRNETKDAIADENMFRAIVNAMSHPMDVTGFFYAFAALKNLTLHCQRCSNVTFPVALSADAVLKATDALIENKDLVLEALGALWALAKSMDDLDGFGIHTLVFFLMKVIKMYRGDRGIKFNPMIYRNAFGVLVAMTEVDVDKFETHIPEIADGILSIMYTCAQELTGDPSHYSELISFGLKVLINMSELSLGKAEIIHMGGIVATIDVLQTYQGMHEIQTLGCTLLSTLSKDNLEVSLCLFETDGVDIIISAMASDPMNSDLQISSVNTLSELSIDDEAREFISRKGGLMLITNAMKNLKEDNLLQKNACSALSALVSNVPEDLLIKSQVIPTVIDSMKYHSKILDVQLEGLIFLHTMCIKGRKFKGAIANAGGIRTITTAAKEHLTSSDLLVRAFQVISTLATLDQCQTMISESNFIFALINGMMANIDSKDLQMQACGALCALSSDPQNKNMIHLQKGTEAIVFAMRVHFDSEPFQTLACKTILSITVGDNAEASNNKGDVIDAIITAMEKFPSVFGLQENAVLVLQCLSESPSNLDFMKEKSEKLVKVLHMFLSHENPSFQDNAVSLLSQFIT